MSDIPKGQQTIRELMAAAATGMKADLEAVRTQFNHRGNRGASAEEIVRLFLRNYLPRRLDIAHGEIADRLGRRSRQTDVVIVNDARHGDRAG